MVERWYRNAVIYSLDVAMFQDSDGDGVGDLAGLSSRIDYLARLGVDTLWLNPIYPSPRRDGGYDVADFYGVDPRFGNLGDFAELLNQADEHGMRIMLDLPINHTSNEHPWFRTAREDPSSPLRNWYVWSETEPPDRHHDPVFPGVQDETWSYDDRAEAWYRHRFYRCQPDLDPQHPQVRAEILKIVAFWLRLGVSGFRLDAAPTLIEPKQPDARPGHDFALLRELRDAMSWRRGDAVLLAEANVSDEELLDYFGEADGEASRVMMQFAFRLNQALMLSLARQAAGPVRDALAALPDLPRHAQWATFLRNHDEVDLGKLSPQEREDVFAEFGPDPGMQLYGRGIRRRLAPMLGGDRRRLEMAYSLQLAMPGTPVLRYGDEIGMGEDLSLPEREAIRTPMQWSDLVNGGFSRAPAEQLVAPVIDTDDEYGYRRVNVTEQRRNPHSMLTWFERILHTRRECEEIGTGEHEVIEVGNPSVLVHRATGARGTMLFLHNLGPQPCRVSVPELPDEELPPLNMAWDGEYDEDVDLLSIELNGYGYRWIRLARNL